ncbi:OprD family outer membrane porin [Thermodesulfobacteriota bacterium]
MLTLRKSVVAIIIVLSTSTGAFAADNITNAFKETRISGEFRSYFFQRDFDGGTTDQEDFAIGGRLHLETGSISGISAGVSFYTSQGMGLNDENKRVYNLLAKDENGKHKSYTALGELYFLGDFGKTTVKVGRHEMRTPWVHLYDIRITPQSFEAVVLRNKSVPDLEIVAGHVTKIKKRTDTTFMYMSKAAGAAQKEPVTLGGITYSGIKGLRLQLWDYYAHEMWNDIYLRADFNRKINDNLSLFGNARYLDRRDVGDQIIGPLDTYMFGVGGGLRAHGATLTLEYGKNGNQPILRPWGHDLAVSIQVHVADRAEEEAWGPRLAYDFGEIGLKGLSGGVIYVDFNTPDSGVNASPDRDEINFDLQYEFSGSLQGLIIRARYAIIDEDETVNGEDFGDFRFYLRYKFSFDPVAT